MSAQNSSDDAVLEERIRAIAYQLWEDAGQPDGCAEAHWQAACEIAAAEAKAAAASEAAPGWLRREAVPVAEKMPSKPELTQSLEQLAKRVLGKNAA